MTQHFAGAGRRQKILDLASKYCFEEKHAHFVEEASLQIFDQLKDRFDLKDEDKELLSHAALLHDTGNFISERKHHKYSKFIVENDESLDVYNSSRKLLLSLIVFNHRRELHKKTLLLPKNERSTVLALSAILRIADALDHTREGIRIKNIDVDESKMVVSIEGVLPERVQNKLNIKKSLFSDVFDLDVHLT